LRQRGIGARRAVIGVPAKWLICKSHMLPPADAETAALLGVAPGAPLLKIDRIAYGLDDTPSSGA